MRVTALNILLIAAVIAIIAFPGCIGRDKQGKNINQVSETEDNYRVITDMRGKDV